MVPTCSGPDNTLSRTMEFRYIYGAGLILSTLARAKIRYWTLAKREEKQLKMGTFLACEARTANPKTRTEGRRPELTTNQSRKATRAQGEGVSFWTKAHPTEVEGMTSPVPGLSVTRNVSAACFHMPVPVAPSARYSSCFRAACRINPRSIFRQSPVRYPKLTPVNHTARQETSRLPQP
jgi:hypothetical protein